jgi:predicted dehydrogenase
MQHRDPTQSLSTSMIQREPPQTDWKPSRRHFILSLVGTAGASGASSAFPGYQTKVRVLDPTSNLRVGMVGTAGHTGLILDALTEIPGAWLAAYAFKDAKGLPANAANMGYVDGYSADVGWVKTHKQFRGETKIYETYQEMFSKEKLDVVGICLPYFMNADACIAAAVHGVHIMSEKPMATELEQLERLRRSVDQGGVCISALLEMRLSPGIRTVRAAIAEGAIGEPVMATAQKSYKFGEARPWFYKSRTTFGGTIPWIGIHAIDFVLYTTGLKVNKIAAFHGNKAHGDYPGVEDEAGILLSLSNGGSAVVTLDYLRPETAPSHGDDRLRVVGSKGVLEMRGGLVELMTSDAPPHQLQLLPQRSIFGDFVRFLRGLGPAVISQAELFDVHRICLLARQAADEKRIIAI